MTERKLPHEVQRGGDQIRGQVPDGWYTRAMVAVNTGVSVSTLKRWHADGKVIPSGYMYVGQRRVQVWLYNNDDVNDIKQRVEQ